ncbi:MAG TPA: YggS family pyridoxal phosphate-dependent enzyme [Thermoanaerobaculia bacterium]|nr:YggS family pyridoxal phosphate-dependent enzyme [Thermoanaerobaculia bacterium]
MLSPDQIRSNLAAVERRIAAACELSGRNRSAVTLVAVSKTFPAAAIRAALDAGATDVGENRVQEARDKKPEVPEPARWHLIGHLQSNKAKDAVRLFDVIHTIDSTALAERVGRAAAAAGKRQEVLIEVNIAREPQKAGTDPADVEGMVHAIRRTEALSLLGLMAIPPMGEPEAMRPYFRELRTLKESLGLLQLSMGMTDDFEVAIEEGATIIRVGRAIFGTRG